MPPCARGILNVEVVVVVAVMVAAVGGEEFPGLWGTQRALRFFAAHQLQPVFQSFLVLEVVSG